ncbi:DgyrCDS7762 [Dimorphilus gyrociliatus]|uniref:DgyrCDS7762 n=1 Tax=Dimorphilus gyrociliatus TaxID=2664684 RepID=A0A7I8VS47_9ANNE|nr:DgyrCDS7762 [Dimorphilus gyrociliatus]
MGESSFWERTCKYSSLEEEVKNFNKSIFDACNDVNKRDFSGGIGEFKHVCHMLIDLKGRLCYVIDYWKICQRKSLNGSGLVEDFQNHGPECLRLIDDGSRMFLLTARKIVEKCIDHMHVNQAGEIINLLYKPVMDFVERSALIIVNQPPQILKVDKKIIKNIPMVVKLLGQDCLKVTSPLQVIPIYECDVEQASRVWDRDSERYINKFGRIITKEHLRHDSESTDRSIVWNIQKLSMDRVNRQEKSDKKDFIREKKYFFVIQVECQTDIPHFKSCLAKDITLPITLIKHVTQTVDALGTIFWFNLFGNSSRGRVQDSQIPTKVKWVYLKKFLKSIWSKKTFTAKYQRPLNDNDLKYLASRVLRCEYRDNFDDEEVTWEQFHRKRLREESGKDFTFWKYFYACLTTASNYKIEWAKGVIFGFATPNHVKAILFDGQRKHGAFLVRFSEKAINKDQSQEVCGQLTLEVLYVTSRDKRIILKTRQNLKEKELKKTGLVRILLSMQYDCPIKRQRFPLLRKLVIYDGSEKEFVNNSEYILSMVPEMSKGSSTSYEELQMTTIIVVDVSKVERENEHDEIAGSENRSDPNSSPCSPDGNIFSRPYNPAAPAFGNNADSDSDRMSERGDSEAWINQLFQELMKDGPTLSDIQEQPVRTQNEVTEIANPEPIPTSILANGGFFLANNNQMFRLVPVEPMTMT